MNTHVLQIWGSPTRVSRSMITVPADLYVMRMTAAVTDALTSIREFGSAAWQGWRQHVWPVLPTPKQSRWVAPTEYTEFVRQFDAMRAATRFQLQQL